MLCPNKLHIVFHIMFITPLKNSRFFFTVLYHNYSNCQFRETHSEIDGAGVLVPKFPCEKELIHSVGGFKPCNFGQSSEIILQICSHTSNPAFSNDFSHRDISTLLRGDFVVCVVNKSTNTNVVEQTPHGNCQNGVTLCCCCCSNAFKRVRRRERIFPFTKKKCCSKTSSFLEVVKSSNFRHCVFGVRRGVKLRLPRECLPEVVRSGRVLFGPAEDAIAIFGRVHAILFGKIQCIKWPGWRKPLFAGAVTLMVQSVEFSVDI